MFMWVNGLTQRPCPWCPWRGFPKSNVQCRMSNEVQWSPMTDKEYQIFISALSTRYWVVGVTLHNVQTTVRRTTTRKCSDCSKPTTFDNNVQIFLSTQKSTMQCIIWFCADARERGAITSRKHGGKYGHACRSGEYPGKITSEIYHNLFLIVILKRLDLCFKRVH